MSATQAHLDELNRIRAERAAQVQAQQQGQQQPQQKSPGAAGAVGQVAGMGAGVYASNKLLGSSSPSTPATPNTPSTTTPSAPSAPTPGPMSIPSGSAAPSGYTAVGTNADGSTLAVPNDSIQSDGSIVPGALQGLGGAYQLYSGYKQFKEGDKVGGGLNMATGATNVAAGIGSSTAGEVVPYLNTALGVYNTGKAFMDDSVTDQERAYRMNKAAGMAIANGYTFGLAGLADAGLHKIAPGAMGKAENIERQILKYTDPLTWGMKAFGSSKDQAQMNRDQVRKAMQGQGALDEGWNLTLADGGKFNIGLDGGGKIMGKDGTEINPYNVDASNPFAHQATAWADPIAAILTGGDPKLRSDFAGYFTNASMSNANTLEGVRANLLNIMAAHKMDFPTALKAVTSMLEAGKIDQATHDIYMNTLGILESGDSKRYDTRTVQQVQAEMAKAAPPVPPAAGVPVVPPVPGPVGARPATAPNIPLAPPPANIPSATTGVPRVTPPPPPSPAAPQQTVAGRPVDAFQKLIDEAKRREQMSGVTNGR